VGSARSGTTLMRTMLNAHPQIAVPPESRFITELWRGTPQVNAAEFLTSLAAHKQFVVWELDIDAVSKELPAGERVDYSAAAEAPYKAYARAHGKDRWGDKTPRYVEDVELLADLFPHAKFVHLVRDGRDVALSYGHVPFGPKTVARAASLWARRVGAGVRAGRALPAGRYIEVRYEDLVEDPEGETRALCDFLELEWDEVMLDTERAREYVLERAARYNPRVTEPATPPSHTWETDMPPAHVEVFESVAGDVLSELAYPRRHPSPRLLARLRAALGRTGLPLDRVK
jgi:hypothetical protein